MAPTLGLIEEKDVSAGVATAESSQTMQMSSTNRGNRVHDGTTSPREQQTEHDDVSPSQENLQDSEEEQRFAISTSRDTVSAQARQAAAAPEFTQLPQPVVNNSSHSSILDVLFREQEERSKVYDQIHMTMMAQAQLAKEHQAAQAETRAQMKAVVLQLHKSDERAQKSDETAQKTLSEVEKMREEFKKREEESKEREEELVELNRKREEELMELSLKREEEITELSRKVRETIQAAVDEERKITLKAIKKETKKEARREKVKEEKKAGKPRKNWSYYNIHVRDERLRLKDSDSQKDLFRVASLSWKEMDEKEREERYGGVYKLDKERYEREMEEWWEKCKVPVDQRKPAAKPTSAENTATADPREFVAHSPPEESAPTAAAPAAPDASDEVSLSSYEQQRLDNIARNNERLKSLGLQSSTGIEAQGNGGILSRTAGTSSVTSKKRREKKRKNTSDGPPRRSPRKPTSVENAATADPRESVAHSPPEESAPTVAAPAAQDASDKGSLESPTGVEAQGNGGILSRTVEGSTDTDSPEELSQPPPEESVAVTVAESRPRVVDNSFDEATKAEEGSTQVPGFIAPTLNEVAATPPVTNVVIHRRQDQEAHGAIVTVAEEKTGDSAIATAPPDTAPFLGVVRNSVEEPAHDEEAEFASPPDFNVIHHRDSAEDPVGAAAPRRLQEATASSPRNVQELPSATPRRRRGKKRKNHSPYWYGNFPVYELEGYTDGTPLRAGYVWVEYDSGDAVQVEENALAKKLPARNSRRKLKHDLFTASSTSRQAGDSSAQPISLPETIHANCSGGSNDVSEVPFPVGYKFYHYVLGGIYHRGYRCVAEVKEIIGDNDGNFASPGSARRCCYYDLDDGSVKGGGKLLVKTIEKKKIYTK